MLGALSFFLQNPWTRISWYLAEWVSLRTLSQPLHPYLFRPAFSPLLPYPSHCLSPWQDACLLYLVACLRACPLLAFLGLVPCVCVRVLCTRRPFDRCFLVIFDCNLVAWLKRCSKRKDILRGTIGEIRNSRFTHFVFRTS